MPLDLGHRASAAGFGGAIQVALFMRRLFRYALWRQRRLDVREKASGTAKFERLDRPDIRPYRRRRGPRRDPTAGHSGAGWHALRVPAVQLGLLVTRSRGHGHLSGRRSRRIPLSATMRRMKRSPPYYCRAGGARAVATLLDAFRHSTRGRRRPGGGMAQAIAPSHRMRSVLQGMPAEEQPVGMLDAGLFY